MGNIFAEIEKIVKLREDIKTLSKDAQSELLYWLFLDGTIDYVEASKKYVQALETKKDGMYIDGKFNGGTDYDLILEVPDNDPKSLYSIEQLGKLKECTTQLMEVNQGVIDDFDNMIQELRKICNSLLKTEFKPFDKVLVRHYDVSLWQPAFFWKFFDELSKTPYYTIDGNSWEQCIPYEGNEHLVGTTDKPKEE